VYHNATKSDVGFEILTAVARKSTIFWDIHGAMSQKIENFICGIENQISFLLEFQSDFLQLILN
jgi:hypothetical protein